MTNSFEKKFDVYIEEVEEIKNIYLDEIYPNKYQPRKVFDSESLNSLRDSISKNGVLQPIILKKDAKEKYMIIAGERRYRASKLLNLETIPAIIKEISFDKVIEIALIENIQREDLSPIEEALAYKKLIAKHDLTQEKIALIINKSRPYVANTMRLLSLPYEIQELINNNKFGIGHAKLLLSLKNDEYKIFVAKKILEENLTVKETEKLIKSMKKSSSKKEEKDIFIIDIEEKLRNILGTKVSISNKNQKGKIEIEYYSEDELNNIISMLID
ncbi:MAG: ParB/RepB/Spo0J family partition protein [Peptostreptococcaceae bacterium]